MSNVGCFSLSNTVFWQPLCFASSSPKVTELTPPTKSDIAGFLIKLSKVLPWAVAINITPRSAIVLAAATSSSVPISSTTITSGVWFSTASIIISF